MVMKTKSLHKNRVSRQQNRNSVDYIYTQTWWQVISYGLQNINGWEQTNNNHKICSGEHREATGYLPDENKSQNCLPEFTESIAGQLEDGS